MKRKSMREKVKALDPTMSIEDIVASHDLRWEIFDQISSVADLIEITEIFYELGILQNGA